jgi:GNAT superfamily N-acetyltransferase
VEFISVTDENLADAVEKLAREIWCEHYTPIIGGAQVAYMVEKFQTAKAVIHQVQKEGYEYYLFRNADGPWIGYFAVIVRASELFLSKFYILAAHRGRGYGKQVDRFIGEIARSRKLSTIGLAVCKKNTDSINIYQKLGFQITGPLMMDIGSGFILDDYKMEKVVNIGKMNF